MKVMQRRRSFLFLSFLFFFLFFLFLPLRVRSHQAKVLLFAADAVDAARSPGSGHFVIDRLSGVRRWCHRYPYSTG